MIVCTHLSNLIASKITGQLQFKRPTICMTAPLSIFRETAAIGQLPTQTLTAMLSFGKSIQEEIGTQWKTLRICSFL